MATNMTISIGVLLTISMAIIGFVATFSVVKYKVFNQDKTDTTLNTQMQKGFEGVNSRMDRFEIKVDTLKDLHHQSEIKNLEERNKIYQAIAELQRFTHNKDN